MHACSGVDWWVYRLYQYHSLENMPMGNEVKWLLKEGGGGIFENPLSLSLSNRLTPFKSRPTLFESRPTQVLENPGITDL